MTDEFYRRVVEAHLHPDDHDHERDVRDALHKLTGTILALSKAVLALSADVRALQAQGQVEP